MICTCAEERWRLCFEGCYKSLSEWQEKVRTNEEDLEEASEGGEREEWFEGGCPESRQVERRSASN